MAAFVKSFIFVSDVAETFFLQPKLLKILNGKSLFVLMMYSRYIYIVPYDFKIVKFSFYFHIVFLNHYF